jgi:AICAR transformylase/IMP cyclohydrolase PurH
MLSEKIWAFWYWRIAAYRGLLRLRKQSGQVGRYHLVSIALHRAEVRHHNIRSSLFRRCLLSCRKRHGYGKMHTQGRTLYFYDLLEPLKKKYASRRTLFTGSSWRIVPPRRPFHPYTVTACSASSAAFFPFSSSTLLFACPTTVLPFPVAPRPAN